MHLPSLNSSHHTPSNGREVHVAEPSAPLHFFVFTRRMGGYHRGVAVIGGWQPARQQAREVFRSMDGVSVRIWECNVPGF